MSSGIEGRIDGVNQLLASLGGMGSLAYEAVKAEVQNACLLVHGTAVKSIQAHESQGRTYKRGGIEHTASAPGHPPNSDRGTLAQSIAFDVDENTLVGTVGTNLDYGLYLELGTKNIEPRPWLLPAFEAHKKEIIESLSEAVSIAVRSRSA